MEDGSIHAGEDASRSPKQAVGPANKPMPDHAAKHRRSEQTTATNETGRWAETWCELQSTDLSASKTVEVLIPAYNEAHNIGVIIETLFASLRDPRYRIEVVVVDDGSWDGTAEIVRVANATP
jgi:cellulose synthase/poly-beta-1,6-N-acetylglucosamine synthase-like glycosyltransferase